MAAAGSFENFTTGTINLQQGWTTQDSFNTSVGTNFDQTIQDTQNRGRVWRMSNAFTSGTYANQPFSPTTAQVAGEAGSSLWNDYGKDHTKPSNPPGYGGNATTTTFYTRVNFTSATGSPQPGLSLGLSLCAKQSTWRMTLIQLNDSGAGIDIIYYNNTLNQYNNGSTFGSTRIASGLSYTAVHSLETVTYFKDGFNNDVVNVFLNGTLIYTSGTWEVYYYFLGGVNVQPRLQAVNSLLVRSSGTAKPSYNGTGFYFTEIGVSTVIPSTVPVILPTPVGTEVVEDFTLTDGDGGGTSGQMTFSEVTSPGITVSKSCCETENNSQGQG